MAVNIEAMMPIIRVRAKPFSGPVPKAYSAMPAMIAVRLASRMVPLAYS